MIAPFALSRGVADLRLLTTYFVVVLGALTLFVAGHYYKIIPFLVWNHRYGPLLGKRKVPKVSELFSERVAFVDAALLASGLAGLSLGISSSDRRCSRGSLRSCSRRGRGCRSSSLRASR
ncbi:MAG: hypothetical protein IPF99_06795 [Deltaproteobacteria bacterium]|nr:hypothetical protein [Deltaproteobacteria bacterium]